MFLLLSSSKRRVVSVKSCQQWPSRMKCYCLLTSLLPRQQVKCQILACPSKPVFDKLTTGNKPVWVWGKSLCAQRWSSKAVLSFAVERHPYRYLVSWFWKSTHLPMERFAVSVLWMFPHFFLYYNSWIDGRIWHQWMTLNLCREIN